MSSLSKKKAHKKSQTKANKKNKTNQSTKQKKNPQRLKKKKRNKGWNQFLFKEVKVQ